MIPDHIFEFLQKQIFIHVGTRDSKLRGREIMAWALRTGDDKKTMTIFIPQATAEKTLSNLKDNGRIAVTCVFLNGNISYQFKGQYISHRDSSEADHALLDKHHSGYRPFLDSVGLPPDFIKGLKNIAYKPAWAVTFRIEEIFNHTPGPEAGKKIA